MAARRIKAYFDGVCEPVNPGGHGAWGAIIRIDGSTTWQEGGYVGQGNHISNNVAEYAAVAEILKRTRDLEGEITIYGDSKLVIYQLRGEWRVKKGLYVPYYEDAKRLLDIQRSKPNFEWFGRDRNSECDQLSKRVLRERGIKLRIQPDEAR